jgi:hypothetical protein
MPWVGQRGPCPLCQRDNARIALHTNFQVDNGYCYDCGRYFVRPTPDEPDIDVVFD